jgi:hypothetical protein
MYALLYFPVMNMKTWVVLGACLMLEICMTLVKKTVKKTVKLVYLKYSTCGTGPFLSLQKKIYSYLARRTTECWRRGIIE